MNADPDSATRRAGAPAARELTLQEALQLAVRLHQGGRLPEAETLYREILRVSPEQPDALHFLGVLSYQLARPEEAIDLISRAIARNPQHPDAHNNLGNVLKAQGRADEAEAAYRRALALSPHHADAHNNLGIVLKARGQADEATEAFRAAVRANPKHADAYHNLGNLLADLGRTDEAVSAYRRVVAINPAHVEALKALGVELYSAGRPEEAIPVYEQFLSAYPDNPVARHMLAACSGQAVPARASDAYLRRVFDGMASTFDAHLAELQYRAPALVAEAVGRAVGTPAAELDVLDAGCGTGLGGPLLRPYARRLVGVDLSSGMVAKARERAVYDELMEAELTAFMAGRPAIFDLIASVDTLVYFGALQPVLEAAARALRVGGRLVFTLERTVPETAEDDYRLNAHGRYSHGRGYMERVLADVGLQLTAMDEVTLRMERGEPVAGLLVSARKPKGHATTSCGG